jgi:FAD/FMN-containing dehydrogenase
MSQEMFPIADLAALGLKVLKSEELSARDHGIDSSNFTAGVAVCPKSLEEVQAIIKLCARHEIAVVPQGGRTGLAGGSSSEAGQLVLMMEELSSIREVDHSARIAVVDAGVTLHSLEAAVAEHGLTVGIDIAARGSCTIGGMIATNAGGGEAFRNGVSRQRVLGLEAVLPDGSVLQDLKKVLKSNEGYDVKQLLIGSEGTLGVITGIVLRLEPATKHRQTVLAVAKNAGDALKIHHRLQQRFGAGFLASEIMWKDYFRTTCRGLNCQERFGDLVGEVYLIAEVELASDDEALLEEIGVSFEAGEILEAVFAKNEQERRDIWLVREDTFQIDKAYPGGCWFDISIPLDELDQFVRESTARIKAIDPGLQLFVMGHLGDGNLHYTVAATHPVAHLYKQIADALYAGLTEIGGSFSAEHGVGTEKIGSLAKYGDPGKLAMMRRIKQALDPQNIMNPGKVIPAL